MATGIIGTEPFNILEIGVPILGAAKGLGIGKMGSHIIKARLQMDSPMALEPYIWKAEQLIMRAIAKTAPEADMAPHMMMPGSRIIKVIFLITSGMAKALLIGQTETSDMKAIGRQETTQVRAENMMRMGTCCMKAYSTTENLSLL